MDAKQLLIRTQSDIAQLVTAFSTYQTGQVTSMQELKSQVEAQATTIADLRSKLVAASADLPQDVTDAAETAHTQAQSLLALMTTHEQSTTAQVIPPVSVPVVAGTTSLGDAAPAPDAPAAPDAAATKDA